MKNLNESKKMLLAKASMLFTAPLLPIAMNVNSFLADGLEVGNAVESSAGQIFSTIETVYCHSVFAIVLVVAVLTWLLSKDDKKKGWGKTAAIGSIVAFIVIKIAAGFTGGGSGGVIGSTIDTIVNSFK